MAAAPDESLVTAMRAYHHRLLAAAHPLSGAIEGAVPFWRVLLDSPALVNRTYEQTHEIQEAIAKALAARTGDETRSRLVAGLLAATTSTVFDIAIRRMLDGDAVEDVRRDQVGVIDDAFDLLERGIGDYGVRPA
jgi:hypothetical protein